MISILIATKNRPQNISECLSSILKSSYSNFEILVIDQSVDSKTTAVIQSFESEKIKYFKHNGAGKTKAINTIIPEAKGELISFIDDDNIVSTDWLKSIFSILSPKSTIAGVFGSILPYQSNWHKDQLCPSTFRLPQKRIVNDPYIIHHQSLGLGSNMSLRKKVFSTVGMFRTWLGPGAFGSSGGEDGELIFRILSHGFTLSYDPNNIVFHNRWLTKPEYDALQARYTAGEISYMTYYSNCGNSCMRHALFITIRNRLLRQGVRQYLKNHYQKKKELSMSRLIEECRITIIETISICKGYLLGTYIWFLDELYSQ